MSTDLFKAATDNMQQNTPFLSTPVAVLLQIRFDASLHALLLRFQGPWLIQVAGRHVGIFEWLAFEQMCQTSFVVVSSVHFRVVVPNPSSNLEEAYVGIFGILLDCRDVGVVELLSIQEPCLLQNAYSLESLEQSANF